MESKKERRKSSGKRAGATARATIGAHPGVALRSTCGGVPYPLRPRAPRWPAIPPSRCDSSTNEVGVWGGEGPRLRSTHYPRVNVVRGVKRRVSLQQGAANVRLQRLIRTDAPRNRLTHLGDESCLCKLWLVLHSVCDFCGGSCLLGSGVGLLLLVGEHLSHPGFVLHRQTCHGQSAKCVARVSRQDCWRRGAGPLVHLLALSSCTPTQEVG
jgi:hypothetical protein